MELTLKTTFEIITSEGYVINPKVVLILKQIEIDGSLNAAVESVGMSYSYAWNLLYKTECKLHFRLLVSKKGGNGGGKTKLTEQAKRLLEYCQKVEQEFKGFNNTLNFD